MENAIEYIEEHLDDKIEIEKVAQKAACSSYHFQRMFSYVAGVSLSEYIRRRRMTLAAFELQQTDVKVIDLAVKYGYDSPSSFTRAFQLLHGVTPSCVRNESVPIMAYPRLSFQFLVRGAEGIQFRMVKTNAYKVFGKEIIPDWELTHSEKWGEYADQVLVDGSHDATNIAAGFPGDALEMVRNDTWDIDRVHLLHGIHFYKEEVRHFMFGWEVPVNGVDKDFTVVNIPDTSWAVFSTNDSDRFAVIELHKYAYTNWFPSSGYEQAECPIIEKYIPKGKNKGMITELWMPVRKKYHGCQAKLI